MLSSVACDGAAVVSPLPDDELVELLELLLLLLLELELELLEEEEEDP